MFQILENSPVGTFIGNLSVYDPDNLNVPLQKFNCVVEDGGPFKVSSVVISVRAVPKRKREYHHVLVYYTHSVVLVS